MNIYIDRFKHIIDGVVIDTVIEPDNTYRTYYILIQCKSFHTFYKTDDLQSTDNRVYMILIGKHNQLFYELILTDHNLGSSMELAEKKIVHLDRHEVGGLQKQPGSWI